MKQTLLYVNACARKQSRTARLAGSLLQKLGTPYEEIRLYEMTLPNVDEAYLQKRDELCRKGLFQDPMFDLARQFSEAETIVIAAPFWDLSFPAVLKRYLELINVTGISFRYTEEGVPVGLCRARRLYYVTTAGGEFVPEEYGFGYVRALAENYYGIPAVKKIMAAGLDLDGADTEAIMNNAEQILSEMDLS